MKTIIYALLVAATSLTPLLGHAEDSAEGSQVVPDGSPCPSGMVVSGMTGGEGDITKICARPNTPEMPDDTSNNGDYSNPENP